MMLFSVFYAHTRTHVQRGLYDLVRAKLKCLCVMMLDFVFYAHTRSSQKKARVGRGRVLPGRTVSRAIYEGNGGTLLTLWNTQQPRAQR